MPTSSSRAAVRVGVGSPRLVRWFSVRDAYGVAVAPGQDDVLVLAIAVCIDELSERAHEH